MRSGAFEAFSARLAAGVRAHPDMAGLVLLGSAADSAAHRRDEWSDHDFFAITRSGRGRAVRPDLSWLPEDHRVVLAAREGEIGFAVVYDDGHVLEFAVSDAVELSGAVAGDATVVFDDGDGTVGSFVASAQERAAAADVFDPANDVRLVLVKLLVGVGRARRGEMLVAGSLVRQWAVQHLVRAIRGRFPERSTSSRDEIDPARRFETDFPAEASRIASALAAPVETAAREVFAATRDILEPGWADFPAHAADVVARRLGWS